MFSFKGLLGKAPSPSRDLTHFQVGVQRLPIIKTQRKNSIGLKLKAEGVALYVPRHLSAAKLQSLLNRHQNWIAQQLERLQAISSSSANSVAASKQPFLITEGASFRWFGVLIDIPTVVLSRQSQVAVWVDEQICQIQLPIKYANCHTRQPRLQKAMQQYFITQAQQYIEPVLALYAEQVGVSVKHVTIKTYKARWGSCYSDGRIQFNWRLLQAPTYVIDYVIVHELCHLVHANHSAAFWDLVAFHYPQTPQAKAYLKKHGTQMIDFLAP